MGDEQMPKSSSAQYLGEVQEDDIIYSLNLRKVFVDVDETQENRRLWTTEIEKTIHSGSVGSLVQHLAPLGRQFVPFYRLCFLSVYRTFVTPSELLLLLIQRYEKIKSEMDGLDDITEHLKTLKSLLSFVKLWIDKCPRDFTDLLTPSETHQLEEFLTTQIALFPETVHDVATLQRQLATPTKSEQTTCKACNHYRCDGSDRQYDWLGMSPIQVAKDLTSLDAEIFRSIVPHQCLHYVRNQRHLSSTVSHSIDTFNNLVGVILYTIIHATNSSGQKTSSARGRAISHWIDVAQCCRQLKNFSSLKAIISGLDSSSIFRLKTSWKKIPNDKMSIMKELHHLISHESNFEAFRNALDKEGTGKSFNKRISNLEVIHGVVPYLGTLLTDLTMLHTALPDTNKDGLINFAKCRKEFELLAKLSLYQTAASKYHLPLDISLVHSLHVVGTSLTESESFRLSNELEPDSLSPSPSSSAIVSPLHHSNHKHFSLRSSLLLTKIGCAVGDKSATLSGLLDDQFSLDRLDKPLSSITKSSSCHNLSGKDCMVARVSMCESNSYCSYKSIKIDKSDQGTHIIKQSLEKYNISSSSDKYDIYQLIKDNDKSKTREIHIPSDSLLFYALSTDGRGPPTILLKLK